MGVVLGIGGVIVLWIVCYFYISIKEKANKNVFSADRYQRQKQFTNQAMLVETFADYNQIYAAIQRIFEQHISAAEAFKGGQYRLLRKHQNKLTYEHMESFSVYAGGDRFECSFSFYQKESKMLIIAEIERWRVSSGVARNSGINAMEDFFNKARTTFLSVDNNAQIRFSGVDQQIVLNGFTSFDVGNVKQRSSPVVGCYCSKCGFKIEVDGLFCPKCGNKLK